MKTWAFIFSVTIPLSVAFADGVETDFDGDGISDKLTTIASSNNLTWVSTPTSSAPSPRTINTSFGIATDHPIPGFWRDTRTPSMAYVRVDTTNDALIWKVDLDGGQFFAQSLGKPGDYVVAGADFNGNGIADAAAVTPLEDGRLRWQITFDLLSSSPLKKKPFTLGTIKDRITILNIDGAGDRAGIFGLVPNKSRAQLTLRNVITTVQKKYVQFPKSLARGSRPRPMPLKKADGTDSIVFAIPDASDTLLRVFNFQADKFAEGSSIGLSGLGAVVLGNFDTNKAGYEVLLQTDSSVKIANLFNSTSTIGAALTTGTIVDSFDVFHAQ